jgi:hypothetical protein
MTESEARAIAAPDSWPWPMSEDASEWVKHFRDETYLAGTAVPVSGPADQFNHEEHERFMKSLG